VRRREFINVFGTTMVALPLPVHAQQPQPLLAVLSPAVQNAQRQVDEPFKRALARFGWEPGRNIDIIERFADGDTSPLPALAGELVSLKPRVLFTNTAHAATAAAEATHTSPIVVGPAGVVTLTALAGGSIARPTTNVTGFVLTAPETEDKCFTLLMEAAPSAARIGVLVNPDNPEKQNYPAALKDARSVVGKTLIRFECRGRSDIDAALAKAAAEQIGAFIADDAHNASDPEARRRVLAFAANARVPVASSHQNYAHDGALIVMGASIPALAAAAAGYVDKILRGATPAELPVQLPTVFTIIINVKAAKAVGISIPATLLRRADEVIE